MNIVINDSSVLIIIIIIALEKNNDDARRNLNSSNRLDPTREIILTDARLEMLGEYARQKRTYEKITKLIGKETYFRKEKDQQKNEELLVIIIMIIIIIIIFNNTYHVSQQLFPA